jgi:hypothetical protein
MQKNYDPTSATNCGITSLDSAGQAVKLDKTECEGNDDLN